MRLSTHLDPEALAKLAAFKSEQAKEAPAPKPVASAGPASMMRAIAAASAVQPRVELPQPPTQPKKTQRQRPSTRRTSQATEYARRGYGKASVKTTRARKPSGAAQSVPQSSLNVFEAWRQGEGKALLKRAKDQGVSRGGTIYWKETSGGLPTLGRGHK